MTFTTPSLLAWPHQVPSVALHSLADAHYIHGLELGPPAWWQQWQIARLVALRQWLEPLSWWQSWLAHAVGPLASSGALKGLPVMRRADYRGLVESHNAIAPPDHGTLHEHYSSGSIGVPVRFFRSELANRISANHYWADHRRQGRNLQMNMATLNGTPGQHHGQHLTLPVDPWLHPGVQWGRNAPQFTMLEHAHWVCQQAPDYLATTPATLSSLLSLIKIKRLPAPRIQQVMTSSHAVEPGLRERARSVLGASIRDRYSCEELGPIAFQCPESDDHYHVAVSNVAVELVDDGGHPVPSGTPGNVLVTGLHQWASPALRYELGDIATGHDHCPGCGATVPALSALMGRKYFLLNTTAGGLRHVRILAEHWLACAPVREHRVVRTGTHSFRAELVLDHLMTAAERSAISAMLVRLIGAEFRFELQQLPAIPWPSGSKRQEFVGLLP